MGPITDSLPRAFSRPIFLFNVMQKKKPLERLVLYADSLWGFPKKCTRYCLELPGETDFYILAGVGKEMAEIITTENCCFPRELITDGIRKVLAYWSQKQNRVRMV